MVHNTFFEPIGCVVFAVIYRNLIGDWALQILRAKPAAAVGAVAVIERIVA